MDAEDKAARFERILLPHLDAAYNLARWLTQNGHDAEDLVQEAYLRAFEYFEAFRGEAARAWLLTIVRNTCYTWLGQNRRQGETMEFDEETHSPEQDRYNPEAILLQNADSRLVAEALEQLPCEFREAIVLRELEGLSYKEIADVTGVPTGTVMSRLARARERLQKYLSPTLDKEP